MVLHQKYSSLSKPFDSAHAHTKQTHRHTASPYLPPLSLTHTLSPWHTHSTPPLCPLATSMFPPVVFPPATVVFVSVSVVFDAVRGFKCRHPASQPRPGVDHQRGVSANTFAIRNSILFLPNTFAMHATHRETEKQRNRRVSKSAKKCRSNCVRNKEQAPENDGEANLKP